MRNGADDRDQWTGWALSVDGGSSEESSNQGVTEYAGCEDRDGLGSTRYLIGE